MNNSMCYPAHLVACQTKVAATVTGEGPFGFAQLLPFTDAAKEKRPARNLLRIRSYGLPKPLLDCPLCYSYWLE